MMHSRYGCGVASLSLLLAVLATGPARAQDAKPGGSLLIADFDGGKVETVNALGGFALAPITDEQMGGTSEARMTPSKPGAQGSRGAAQMSFRVTDDFPRPFAGAWALLGPPTDLTAYKGLRFYARSKGEGKTFLAGFGQFTGGQSANYMAPFEAKPEWTLVELPFDKLQRIFPPGQGPVVPKDVVSIGFSASSRVKGQSELEVDQVEIYK